MLMLYLIMYYTLYMPCCEIITPDPLACMPLYYLPICNGLFMGVCVCVCACVCVCVFACARVCVRA